MKTLQDVNSTLNIASQTDAFNLLRLWLSTSYPMALWRLPNERKIVALLSLDREQKRKFETLSELKPSFVVNGYHQSHPVDPTIIEGDIIIEMCEAAVEVKIRPEISSEKLDQLAQIRNQTQVANQSTSFEKRQHVDFVGLVQNAVDTIRNSELSKVVLSRHVDHPLSTDFDVFDTFQRLVDTYPSAFCYFTQTSASGRWMGATPERLISIEGNKFTTDALAGTQWTSEQKHLSDVAWTQKDIEEQAMVSRYIIDCFKKIRLREFHENGPKTVKAGNLLHLKTEFVVAMDKVNYPTLGDEMLELLHPTSAVCGYPRDLADRFILEKEGYDRSLYAGFLGPVGFDDSSHLFVNLRCIQIADGMARLYAGAGITADSDPRKEFQETENKMRTMLNVLKS